MCAVPPVNGKDLFHSDLSDLFHCHSPGVNEGINIHYLYFVSKLLSVSNQCSFVGFNMTTLI